MQVKVCSPEESGRIVARQNVHFSNGNYETTVQSLQMKKQNAGLNLKGAAVI